MMHHLCQSNTKGLLTNGELDFSWLAQNSDELLDKSVVRLLVDYFGGVNINVHGKLIRFAKRIKGNPIRINLGCASFSGVSYSAKMSKEFITASESELLSERAKREKRSSLVIALKDVCIDYETKEMVGLKPAIVKGYKTLLNRLIKHFNHIPLDKISHYEVENWVTSSLSNAELSWKTVKETLWMLDQILSRTRLMGVKPTEQGSVDFKKLQKYIARFKQRNKTVEDTKTLTLNDIVKLEALDHELLLQNNLNIIRDSVLLTAKAVAARSGEARAIALEDITQDSSGNYKVNISRALVLEQFKEPKAYDKSLSVIDVFDVAKVYLERLIEHAKSYTNRPIKVLNENNEVVTQDVSLLVINPITGNHYTEKEYREEFYRLQNFANIAKPIPPKQLRHTAVRLFNEAGVTVSDFSKQLTHANDNTTIEFYSGVVSRGNTPEITKLINIKLDKLWVKEPTQPGITRKQPPERRRTTPVLKNIPKIKKTRFDQCGELLPDPKYQQPNLTYLPNSP